MDEQVRVTRLERMDYLTMEQLNQRMEAIDLLLEHGHSSPAVILMRPIIEHILYVQLIDNGLWSKAIGNNRGRYPSLWNGYNTLKEEKKLYDIFDRYNARIINVLRDVGNAAAHNNDDIDIHQAQGYRSFFDSIIPRFAQMYPDEQYFHPFARFTVPVIDVTSTYINKRVAIKAKVNERYISVNMESPDTDIICSVCTADRWEWFDTMESDGKSVGFRSAANEKWLSMNLNEDALLRVNGPDLSSWERFRIYKSGDNYYILSMQNSKFVKAEQDNNNITHFAAIDSRIYQGNCDIFSIEIIR